MIISIYTLPEFLLYFFTNTFIQIVPESYKLYIVISILLDICLVNSKSGNLSKFY